MKKLTSRDKIQPDALIHYVIDGMQDDTNINKMVLYRARKLDKFKERLKAYEAIRKKKNQEKKSIREKSSVAD